MAEESLASPLRGTRGLCLGPCGCPMGVVIFLWARSPCRSGRAGGRGFGIIFQGLGVSGSGFQFWGFCFGVQGVGFRVQGFGFWVSGFRFRIQGFGFRVSGFRFRVSSFEFRVRLPRAKRARGGRRTLGGGSSVSCKGELQPSEKRTTLKGYLKNGQSHGQNLALTALFVPIRSTASTVSSHS